MDKDNSKKIIEYVGGVDNIVSVYHCITRIRFLIKEKYLIRFNDLRHLSNVIDVIYANGQLMIVLETDLKVIYEDIKKYLDQKDSCYTKENVSETTPFLLEIYNSASSYLLATLNPFIDIMIGVGALKILLILANWVSGGFEKTYLYTILTTILWTVYLVIPLIISFNGARALGINPLYSIIVSTILSIDMYLKGISVVNVSISCGKYEYNWFCSSLLLSSLMISPTLYHIERIVKRRLPVIRNHLAIEGLTVFCSIVTGFFLFPFGIWINNLIVNTVIFLNYYCGPILSATITVLLPYIIIRGMHASIGPLLITMLILTKGYDPLVRIAFLIHNFAEGGAVLGYYCKSKTRAEHDKFFNIIKKCVINGISEPALLKVNLRRKENIIGVMIGGAVASFTAQYWDVKAYFWGEATIFALPIFLNKIGYMFLTVVLAFFVSAVVVCILTDLLKR